MRNFKKMLALGLSFAMAMSFAACGSNNKTVESQTPVTVQSTENSQSTGTGESDVVDDGYENCTLTFSWWGGDSRHEATLAAVEAFEQKYPGIEVECTYGTWSNWEDSMATMFATKTAPDVNQINWNWITAYSADGSAFMDLNSVSDILDLEQYPAESLEQCMGSDKLQAIPVSMTGRIFYWNKATFDKAGIEVPASLADLKAAGETFRTKLGDDYYPLVLGEYDRMILMVYYLESVYGKPWVADGQLQYTQEEIETGLAFIQSLEDAHVTPSIKTILGDGADSLDKNPKWMNGTYAGIFEWDSSASKFSKALAEGQELVVGNYFEDMGSFQGGYSKVSLGFAISETCQHPREAAMLLNFLLNEEEGTTIMASERGIPLSAAALENCKSKNLLDETVAEANGKVLAWVSYPIDPTFESAALKSSDGVYYDVMAGLSYKEYSTEQAAQLLTEGINDVLTK